MKKWIVSCSEKHQKLNKCRYEKMTDQKKSRAFRIHSNMSRHEMPNMLKKMIVSCLGNIKFLAGVWNEKMMGPKKIRYSGFTQKLL